MNKESKRYCQAINISDNADIGWCCFTWGK